MCTLDIIQFAYILIICIFFQDISNSDFGEVL